MKVLVIQGGLTSYFRLLLERLEKVRGLEIALIIPANTGSTLGSGVKTDESLTSFKIFPLTEYKAWYGKAFFKDFENVIEEFRPNIILTGYPYMIKFVLDQALYKRLCAKNIKFIYRDIPWNIPFYGKARAYFKANNNQNEHDGGSKGFVSLIKFLFLTEVRKRYLRLADGHLYYTDAARELIQSYGVQKERIFISANSPDTDVFLNIRKELLQSSANQLKGGDNSINEKAIQAKPDLSPETAANDLSWNPFRLIHVGRLVRWKRVDLILEAVASLQSHYPGVELLIAGFGPEEENLQKQALTLGIADRIQFLGGVYDPKQLGRCLMSSGIYILAGMGGLSINDAMCFAKPVICSEADGTEKRLVREGENGLYFKAGNSESLAEKIKILFDDPQKMQRFGERSLSIIENEVNIHTVLHEYIEAFNFVTENAFSISYF